MAALHVQCWQESYVGIVPAALLASFTPTTRLPMWQANLADHSRIIWAAFDDNQPQGFAIASDGNLAALYLRASAKRHGLGRKLLALAAQSWLEAGGTSLTLSVLDGNQPAIAFYEAMGARLLKKDIYDWSGNPLPNRIYVFDDLQKLAAP